MGRRATGGSVLGPAGFSGTGGEVNEGDFNSPRGGGGTRQTIRSRSRTLSSFAP